MDQSEKVYLVATNSKELAKLFEDNGKILSKIKHVYLVSRTGSIDEFREQLVAGGGEFCLFEIAAFRYSEQYSSINEWIAPILNKALEMNKVIVDPYATKLLKLPDNMQ